MSEKETVNVEVSEGLIKPIIEAKIRAAIAAEMSKNPSCLIDALVTESLQFKVDASGKHSQYSSDNRYTWLSTVLHNAVRESAKKALEEMIAEHQDKIKNCIKAALKKEVGVNKIAAAVITGMTEHLKCAYSSRIEVKFDSRDE